MLEVKKITKEKFENTQALLRCLTDVGAENYPEGSLIQDLIKAVAKIPSHVRNMEWNSEDSSELHHWTQQVSIFRGVLEHIREQEVSKIPCKTGKYPQNTEVENQKSKNEAAFYEAFLQMLKQKRDTTLLIRHLNEIKELDQSRRINNAFEETKKQYEKKILDFERVAKAKSTQNGSFDHDFVKHCAAAHRDVLKEIDDALKNNNAARATFTRVLEMQTGALSAAIGYIDPNAVNEASDTTKSALQDTPKILAELAVVPTANKVLGAVLATLAIAFDVIAISDLLMIGLAVAVGCVPTFGLPLFMLLTVALCVGLFAATASIGLGLMSYELSTTPTKAGEKASFSVYTKVVDADEKLRVVAKNLLFFSKPPSPEATFASSKTPAAALQHSK